MRWLWQPLSRKGRRPPMRCDCVLKRWEHERLKQADVFQILTFCGTKVRALSAVDRSFRSIAPQNDLFRFTARPPAADPNARILPGHLSVWRGSTGSTVEISLLPLSGMNYEPPTIPSESARDLLPQPAYSCGTTAEASGNDHRCQLPTLPDRRIHRFDGSVEHGDIVNSCGWCLLN